MKLQTDERQRCAECGEQKPHLIRFDRGLVVCNNCLSIASRILWSAQQYPACPTCGEVAGYAGMLDDMRAAPK